LHGQLIDERAHTKRPNDGSSLMRKVAALEVAQLGPASPLSAGMSCLASPFECKSPWKIDSEQQPGAPEQNVP
ncbi:Hypothetical predicted protein, partial [Podarcis lilfordi]